MKVTVTIYSFSKLFSRKVVKVKDFVDFCYKLGTDAVDLGYYWESRDEMSEVKRILKEYGMPVACYITSNDFAKLSKAERDSEVEKVKKAVDDAVFMESTKLRIFAGDYKPGLSYETAKPLVVECLRKVVEYAESNGVILVLENHGRLFGKIYQIRELLEEISSPYLKLNFDIGNWMIVGDNPVKAAEELYDSIGHVHVKDWRIVGGGYRGTTIGEGIVPLKEVLQVLKDRKYDKYLCIEYEGEEDPRLGIRKSFNNLKNILLQLK